MVLVYAESPKGQFKKSAFEAVTYGKMVADVMGKSCAAIVIGNAENAGQLGKYGASKVIQANGTFEDFDSQVFSTVIANVAKEIGAEVVIVNHSSSGKSLLGRLAVKLDAGSVSGVNSVPTIDGSFKVKKNVFSGKAIAEFEVKTSIKVLSLIGNSFPPAESGVDVSVDSTDATAPTARVTVKTIQTVEGTVPLPEAELVVSAGRGMKGPENWGMIEELATVVGATTACSRPVADIGWRPHHEHVGQTGVAIRPNLYFAIGISGAIQHLAGVNSSKVIVVINKDPEAPFLKRQTMVSVLIYLM